MSNTLIVIANFIKFLCQYGTMKCMKTMLMGLVMIPVIMLIRLCNKSRHANIDFYAALLLLPMVFTGMSKLFYNRYTYFVTDIIYKIVATKLSIVYFIVMFILLFRFLYKNRKLKCWVNALEPFEDKRLCKKSIENIMGYPVSCQHNFYGKNVMAEKYLNKVRVYATREDISPFSGGILRPYIVIPKQLFNDASEEEQLMMLCHEYMHIKSGHIVWISAFRLLWIYWWVNPLMILLNNRLREDMEKSCDEKCICYTKVEAYSYGSVLLSVAGNMRKDMAGNMASFIGGNDYGKIKNRISYIKLVGARKNFIRKFRIQTFVFTMVFFGMLAVIWCGSYPRYSVMKELFLYDENLNFICMSDSVELQRAVKAEDGELVINTDGFDNLIKQYGITGDYVYIGFDTIYKVPGWGGCGNVGMVSTDNCNDICYLSGDNFLDCVMEFCLKYLI